MILKLKNARNHSKYNALFTRRSIHKILSLFRLLIKCPFELRTIDIQTQTLNNVASTKRKNLILASTDFRPSTPSYQITSQQSKLLIFSSQARALPTLTNTNKCNPTPPNKLQHQPPQHPSQHPPLNNTLPHPYPLPSPPRLPPRPHNPPPNPRPHLHPPPLPPPNSPRQTTSHPPNAPHNPLTPRPPNPRKMGTDPNRALGCMSRRL